MASGSNPKINEHDEVCKTPRHPRWTQQETITLIQGKRIVEGRGRKGRKSGSTLVESKWDAVSSHCKRNGVDRGPIQCRKRWSNLLSDFKKIKTWDSQEVNVGGESFWAMRSELRREKKLPGFFDRDVYDVMDVGDFTENQLALVTVSVEEDDGLGGDRMDDDDENTESDENRGGLSSEFDRDSNLGKEKVDSDDKVNKIPSPVPISEHKRQPDSQRDSEFQEGAKRSKRPCRDSNTEDSLIKAVERNTKLLNAHFEQQKMNWDLDREQKKEEHLGLVAALANITDVLERIAKKL